MSEVFAEVAGEKYAIIGPRTERLPFACRACVSTCAVRVEISTSEACGGAFQLERLDSGLWRLKDESVEALIAGNLGHVQILARYEELCSGVCAALRVVAILRCNAAGGLVLHASGVELGGKAFLFAGPSGCGKTTSAAHAITGTNAYGLADDTAFVVRRDGIWMASGLPWEPNSCGRAVPLGAIACLGRSSLLKMERLSSSRAAAALLALPGVNLSGDAERAVSDALERVESLAATTPVFRLWLPPDPEAIARFLRALV